MLRQCILKGMKTYLLLTEWTLRTGDHGYETEILSNFDLARIHRKREIRNARADYSGDGIVEDTVDVDSIAEPQDISWSIWEDGNYLNHHCTISLIEHDVIE